MSYGKALIFDTECTGIDDDREIIEAAWLHIEGDGDEIPVLRAVSGRHFEQRYKPSVPLTHGSIAVHNILPHELEDCPPSWSFALPDDIEYLVGHSIDFDWEAAGAPGHIKRICTYAMSQWVWPDIDSYSQSAVLYRVLGSTEETRERLRDAHSAYADVLNNLRLLIGILEERPEITTWSDLWAFSEECRVPRLCHFRQHKNVPWTEVAENDPGFCHWVMRQDWVDPYVYKAVCRAMGYGEEAA